MKLLNTVKAWPVELLADGQKAFPSVQFVTAQDHSEVLREIVDAEIVFGRLSKE